MWCKNSALKQHEGLDRERLKNHQFTFRAFTKDKTADYFSLIGRQHRRQVI